MCGLSGYIGLPADKQTRLMLVMGLADGIDNRGGHACGYVSIAEDGDLRYARKKGVWVRARLRFMEGAAGDICLMHARYATCGNRDSADNAHPFAIRRNGRIVMWGAHNGMVPDAWESAKRNDRKIEVDSQEIFELLADGDYEGIQSMGGYGVVTWIDADHREHINLARLSSHSEIVVVGIKGGGVVWASTKKILDEALKFADLEADQEFKIDEIGRVYRITPTGVYKSKLNGVKVNSHFKGKGSRGYSSSTDDVSTPSEEIDEQALVETKDFTEATSGSGAYTVRGWEGMYSD